MAEEDISVRLERFFDSPAFWSVVQKKFNGSLSRLSLPLLSPHSPFALDFLCVQSTTGTAAVPSTRMRLSFFVSLLLLALLFFIGVSLAQLLLVLQKTYEGDRSVCLCVCVCV